MPLPDITNPDIIKFLVESYEKTARLRLKWNRLHADKLKQAATLENEKGYYDTDVLKAAMAVSIPTMTRDYNSGAVNRRVKAVRDGLHIPTTLNMKKGHSIAEVGLGDAHADPRLGRPDTDLTVDPLMRPVDPIQNDILYKDIPRFGREMYLKNRRRLAPEDKFYFKETSGWEYGWRLGDSTFSHNAPAHGRVWHLTHGTKSRSGPHPDPPHYNSIQSGLEKCRL